MNARRNDGSVATDNPRNRGLINRGWHGWARINPTPSTIALAWVLNSAYFEGTPPPLRQLARRCGVQPATLARHTGRFSRLIGWRNRAQRHAWNWREEQRSPLGGEGEKKADNRES